MFKVGDKVVCIIEPESDKYLKIGDTYIISFCYDMIHSSQLLQFEEIPKHTFSADRFKSVIDFRKDKINKIKERICSK